MSHTPVRFSYGSGAVTKGLSQALCRCVQLPTTVANFPICNPARPWLKIEPSSEDVQLDNDGKAWVDSLVQTVFGVMSKSNFYNIMAQAFEDVVVFGTAPVIIYEDFDDVIRCYLPCAGEHYLKVGARFSNDTIVREFCMTVQQIVEMFTIENCPEQVRNLWNNGGALLQQEFVVCHIIEPNFEIANRVGGRVKVVPGKFTFREMYWLRGTKTDAPLSRKGFNGRPFFTLIWARTSNDPYGRSPCMNALGDNKQVQRETLRKGEFIEKLVRPPMGANVEMKNEPSSILPGMTTYTSTDSGKKGFWPLFEVQPQALAPLVQDIEGINKRIEKALFVDVFMAITQMQGVEPRNELELTKRDLERLQKLGPVIDLVEGALAQGVIRIIDIVQRRKMIKPMPDSMKGIGLKLTFETLLRLAQRSSESQAMKDTFATLGGLSSAAKAAGVPDPIRIFNLDKSAKKYATANNYPIDCIYSEKEVEQHDQQRAKAVQAAQTPDLAMAGVKAAKTLSDTVVPGGTALGAMLGGGAGGP